MRNTEPNTEKFFIEVEASSKEEATEKGKEKFDRIDHVKGKRKLDGGSHQLVEPDEYFQNTRKYAIFGTNFLKKSA